MPDPTVVFADYPKVREPLSPELAEIYTSQYLENRNGGSTATSLAQRMEQWMHRKVSADLASLDDPRTLEIGAGTLNHLDYEPGLTTYDIVEPFHELYRSSTSIGRVRKTYDDIAEVPAEETFDRIVSIATFEHVCNLPEVVAQAGLLLADNGSLRVAIPSEGAFLWTMAWKCTTGLEFRLRTGLDYGELMAFEHVNTAAEIEAVLRHFFGTVERSLFGPSRALSFYQFFECRDPEVGACASMVETRAAQFPPETRINDSRHVGNG